MNFFKKEERIEPSYDYDGLEEKTRIDKRKIIKYAGSALILTSLAVGGLAIYDSGIDHTEEICPICKIASIPVNANGLTIGIQHQISEMEKEYDSKYLNAVISYEPDYMDGPAIVSDITFQTSETDYVYACPPGYLLEYDENGMPYAVKTIYVKPTQIVRDGEIVYMAPSGYALEMQNGSYVCVKKERKEITTISTIESKTIEEQKVLKLTK